MADTASRRPPPPPPPPLDMRFADQEDRDDIVAVVNAAFAVEVEGEEAFRSKPRLDATALEAELAGSSTTRWIVLDDRTPTEDVVAAAAMLVFGGRAGATRSAQLLVLAVKPEVQGTGAGTFLLQRCESVCRGLGCRSLGIEVAAHRDVVHEWLKRRGWTETGGGLWSEEQWFARPTPHLILSKDLTALSPLHDASAGSGVLLPVPPLAADAAVALPLTADEAAAAAVLAAPAPAAGHGDEPASTGDSGERGTGEANDIAAALDLAHTMAEFVASLPDPGLDAAAVGAEAPGNHGGAAVPEGGADNNDLESLVGNLMAQLNTNDGREEFARLVQAEEPNVMGVQLMPDGTAVVREEPRPPPAPAAL